MPRYTRRDFTLFFARKYWRLLKAALILKEGRADYRDPKVVADIISAYMPLASRLPAPTPDLLPRQIFMLWQQGWDKAPDIVKACAESWQRHNPDWELHLLDEEMLPLWVPDLDLSKAPKSMRTARANLTRLALLQRHGGVWADATLFCARPLSDWLPAQMASGLFLFSYPRPYRYVDIWFMAAVPQLATLQRWQAMIDLYWRHFRHPHHYYWMEYLFEFLIERDAQALQSWEAMPRLSAVGPLTVGGNPFDREAPEEVFKLIANAVVPAHKLSHKWRYEGSLAGTPLGALTGLERL